MSRHRRTPGSSQVQLEPPHPFASTRLTQPLSEHAPRTYSNKPQAVQGPPDARSTEHTSTQKYGPHTKTNHPYGAEQNTQQTLCPPTHMMSNGTPCPAQRPQPYGTRTQTHSPKTFPSLTHTTFTPVAPAQLPPRPPTKTCPRSTAGRTPPQHTTPPVTQGPQATTNYNFMCP